MQLYMHLGGDFGGLRLLRFALPLRFYLLGNNWDHYLMTLRIVLFVQVLASLPLKDTGTQIQCQHSSFLHRDYQNFSHTLCNH